MRWTVNGVRSAIISHPSRFKVLACGRRWGKTHLALLWLLMGKIYANERRWVILPTYKQAKLVAFPILKALFREFGGKIHETELSVTINGAEIALKGADNEDSLRGVGLDRVVMDEYAYMKPHVWQEIVLPMLMDTGGNAMFIGTPDGYNHFYDLYLKGLGNDPDWQSWQYTTAEGGFVPIDEMEKAKSNMDGRLFRQEFEATFETAGNRVAYNFDRDTHLRTAKELSSKKFWACDFNVDYMTALLCCEYSDSVIHYYHEIRLANSNTEELASYMKKACPNIPCYPDPAGSARSTTSSKSDHQILRDNGFRVVARRSHPSHRDRLNALNRKLKDANGIIGMTVDPSCKYLIKDLELCQRDKNGGIAKDVAELTHALDACSYLVSHKFPISKRRATSTQW